MDTKPTDNQLCDGLGIAHGFASRSMAPTNPRKALSTLLDWPEALISLEHLSAYFDGYQAGRDYQRTL